MAIEVIMKGRGKNPTQAHLLMRAHESGFWECTSAESLLLLRTDGKSSLLFAAQYHRG